MATALHNNPNKANTKQDSPFSAMLKKWRKFRRYSQLDLALEAGISQRHLSFLESGRSRPGQEMVMDIAEALNMPLRDRNQLLHNAGFAAVYSEHGLDDDAMLTVQKALTMTLDHHAPYPALVIDRNWNLYMSNKPAQGLLAIIGQPDDALMAMDRLNIYRMTFNAKGLRPFIANWQAIANPLLLRLQREVHNDPSNGFLAELLEEMQILSGISQYSATDIGAAIAPVLPLTLDLGGIKLSLFSMISAFGTALDVTASELRVETFFPADEQTRHWFEQQLQQAS